MSYDDIFEAAKIFASDHRHHFTLAELRQLVDHFVENWEPRKSAQDDNEKDFEIQRTLILGGYLIQQVYYPNCPQSTKIMVHVHSPCIYSKLEPHFGKNNSPVARFQPSEEGWSMAIQFVSAYIK
jgi:hypothetical protein